MNKKIISILGLLVSVSFIFAGLYVYLFKGAPIQLLIITILFFGTCVVAYVIYLINIYKSKKWFIINSAELSKKQNMIMAISSLIFSICSLWIALVIDLHIILRAILVIGFLFFLAGPIILLKKQ